MEIDISVKYESIDEESQISADSIFRDIYKKYPEGVWEKSKEGYRITI